jgi:hypothetical protein
MTNITDILEMKARIVVAPENPFRMDSRALGDDVPRAGLTAAWRGPGARSPSVFKKGVTPPHAGPTADGGTCRARCEAVEMPVSPSCTTEMITSAAPSSTLVIGFASRLRAGCGARCLRSNLGFCNGVAVIETSPRR